MRLKHFRARSNSFESNPLRRIPAAGMSSIEDQPRFVLVGLRRKFCSQSTIASMLQSSEMPRVQQTLRSACTISGRGYWTGVSNTLHFCPAEENFGIQFEFMGRKLPAITDNSSGMSLRTRIGTEPLAVDMVEHVMAALFGLQVDNCLIVCEQSEIPGFDGSSLAIALALQSAGIRKQTATRATFVVQETLRVGTEDCWIMAEPSQSGGTEIGYQLEYPSGSPIANATFQSRVTRELFLSQIAPARTFISEAEATALQDSGLAKHVTHQDLLVFGSNGPINNSLRFPDECARHKALDLLGDLALSGVNLIGRFTARKSGHQLNAQMARLLRETALAAGCQTVPALKAA